MGEYGWVSHVAVNNSKGRDTEGFFYFMKLSGEYFMVDRELANLRFVVGVTEGQKTIVSEFILYVPKFSKS